MRRAALIIAAILLVTPATAYAEEIPQEIEEAAERIGTEYNVSPALIEAICYEESRFTPQIVNKSGKNFGLMQVNLTYNTARMERLGVTKEELLTVEGNILVATDLLAELFEQYDDACDVILVYGGFSKAKIARYHQDGTMPAYIVRLLERAAKYEERRDGRDDTGAGENHADGDQGDGLDG